MGHETTTSIQKSQTLKRLHQAIYWTSFPFGILVFVLPIYGKELGATALEIGGFFSAFAIIPLIMRPFLGRALDIWGRRPFLLLGLFGYMVSVAVFCIADTVLLLTIARFVQGLGTAFLWISANTIIADVAMVSGRGHDFGMIDEATNRGAIIGTSLGFFALIMLKNIGLEMKQVWFWIFVGFTVPAFLGLWHGWRGVQETRPPKIESPSKSQPISRQLLVLMGIVLITGASSAMVWPLLMVFLQDILQAEVWALAIAYLPAALLSSFLPSRMGKIADRLGRKTPMTAGLLIGALASVLIPHLRSIIGLAVLWAVESLGYIIAFPAERAFVADIAGEDVRGTSYGMYTFAFFLGAVLGPLAGGWLYDNLGHASPFYLNTVVLTIGAVLVVCLLRESNIRISSTPAG